MSQHDDQYLDNQPGAPFRAELNQILAAHGTSNSGSTEPPNPYGGMLWLNTSRSPWALYRRNDANTGWLQFYDQANKPGKADVGLSNVPNYSATYSLTDGSTTKFALAKATKDLEDKKLDKTATAADSAKLGGVAAASYALQTGAYSGLRAQATTKGDVGLGSVGNYGASSSVALNSNTTYALSSAVYSLNQSKLGKTETATNSDKLGGKAPSSYANSVHSHTADQLPSASLSVRGVVQLINSTTSTSTTLAVCAAALKTVWDKAVSAYNLASGKLGDAPKDGKFYARRDGAWVEVETEAPGVVKQFAGAIANIPAGYALCNGVGTTSNGIPVPDLRDRFVVGAGSAYAVGAKGGSNSKTTNDAGGHTHTVSVGGTTLSVSQTPSHKHTGGFGRLQGHAYTNSAFGLSSTTTYGVYPGAGGSSKTLVYAYSSSIGGSGSHSHTASSGSSGDHSHTVNVEPPYYALAYIIKL